MKTRLTSGNAWIKRALGGVDLTSQHKNLEVLADARMCASERCNSRRDMTACRALMPMGVRLVSVCGMTYDTPIEVRALQLRPRPRPSPRGLAGVG